MSGSASWLGRSTSPAEVEPSRLQAEANVLGVQLDEAQAEQLNHYVAQLERWNARFNLISRRDIGRIWPRHILDSLSVAALLPSGPAGSTDQVTVFDIGTGAGLPGLPLAIALPELSWLLLDRNQRKIRFLETIITELGLPNVTARVADLGRQTATDLLAGADIVVSRAVDDPTGLSAMAEPLLKPNGRLVLMTATSAADDSVTVDEPAQAICSSGGTVDGKRTGLSEGFNVIEVHEVRIPGLDRTHEVTIIERVT